jgi:hypothetical protein
MLARALPDLPAQAAAITQPNEVLLVAHAIAGTHAKVSLGSFPPLLAVVTAIIGMFLAAGGGRIVRAQRERAGLQAPPTDD